MATPTQSLPSPIRRKRGPKATGLHNARLDFRLPLETKQKIEEAALASGQSLSDFAASTLAREADEVLQRRRMIQLSQRDWELFVALLQGHDEPNQNLQTLAALYRKHTHVEGEVTHLETDFFAELPAELKGDPH